MEAERTLTLEDIATSALIGHGSGEHAAGIMFPDRDRSRETIYRNGNRDQNYLNP